MLPPNRCVETDDTGMCVFAGCEDGAVRVWDMRTTANPANVEAGDALDDVSLSSAASLVQTLKLPARTTGAVSALHMSADRATLAAGTATGHLMVWERPRAV